MMTGIARRAARSIPVCRHLLPAPNVAVSPLVVGFHPPAGGIQAPSRGVPFLTACGYSRRHLSGAAVPACSSSVVPTGEVMYSESHEWIRCESETEAVVGVTAFAAEQLGEIVYVDFLDRKEISKGKPLLCVESVKSVGEVLAPVNCTIEEVNEAVSEDPKLITNHPEGEGWLVKVRIAAPLKKGKLMTSAEYLDFNKTEGAQNSLGEAPPN